MLVVPVRRGTLVVPVETKWVIKRDATDPTSKSLHLARRLAYKSVAHTFIRTDYWAGRASEMRTSPCDSR